MYGKKVKKYGETAWTCDLSPGSPVYLPNLKDNLSLKCYKIILLIIYIYMYIYANRIKNNDFEKVTPVD